MLPRAHGDRVEHGGLEHVAVVAAVVRQLGQGRPGERVQLARRACEEQHAGQGAGGDGAAARVGQRGVGLPQVRGGGRPADERLHAAELQQQLRTLGRRRRLLQRALQVGDRALGGAAPPGGPGGVAKRLDDPRLVVAQRMQELGGDGVHVRTGLAQRAGGPQVGELPLGRRQLAVHGVVHERVDEAERRLRPQDLGGGEDRHGICDLAGGTAGERRDDPGVRALAQQCDGPRDRDRRRPEPPQPQQHRARDGARPDLADHAGRVGVGPHALGVERAQQLPQEQRVAAGAAVARLGEGRRRLAAQLAAGHGTDGRRCSAARARW